MKTSCKIIVMTISSLLCCSLSADEPGHEKPRINVALGKKYVFNKSTQTTAFTPNYGHSMDEADATQLTDGKFTDTDGGNLLFWVQKSTVGWRKQPVVIFTLDLEQVEPISGLSYSTAGMPGNVGWPAAISIFVGDNDKDFYYVDDIVRLSAARGVPKDEGYSTHRCVAEGLAAKGRYVRLVIRAGMGGMTVCDEVEIYRGLDSLLKEKRKGQPLTQIKQMEAFSLGMVTDAGVRARLRKDLAAMRERVEASELASNEKAALLQRLDVLAPQINTFPKINEEGFRAIVPMNDLHAQIVRINAPLLRNQGMSSVCIWKKNRWDRLSPYEMPLELPKSPSAIDVVTMNSEYRSAAFNITNPSDEPVTASVRIEGLPGGTNPDYVTVHQVEYVDTIKKEFVANALPSAEKTDNGYAINVPAGMTRQVWLTFNPRGIKRGSFSGSIVVQCGKNGSRFNLPLELRIFGLTFPKQPTLSLVMFEFSNNRFGDATDAAIADLRNHFVDSPWANNDALPTTDPSMFDKGGNLIRQPDFSTFDAWIKLVAPARYYPIFFNVKSGRFNGQFAGKRVGTAEFRTALSQWAAAWAEHNRKLGLTPGQVGLLLLDEASNAEHGQEILQWAEPIKTGTSEIKIFEDPIHTAKWYDEAPEAFDICDILCPNMGTYEAGQPRSGEIYSSLLAKGKTLWFYQCSGPVRLMDPYYYNRLSSWYCFKYNATGNGFWSYSDTGWAPSSWNMYRAASAGFSPVYISQNEVVTGKHWEAVREGIEDYEYLYMLRERIRQLQPTADATGAAAEAQMAASGEVVKAQKVLSDVLQQVAPGDYSQKKAYQWGTEKDRSIADKARLDILESLEKLRNY